MGLCSASSSSDNWGSSLSSEEEEDVACVAPLGDNGSMGRGRERCSRIGFFVGCKNGERKRVLCENEVFVGCKSRERKRALGEKGPFVGSKLEYLWPEEPIQSLLKKLLLKILE
jgi:hypothetical protein